MWPFNLISQWGKKMTSLELFRELYGHGRQSKAGRTVTLNTAIEVSTVFACCRVLGEGVSQVPLKLIKVSEDGKSRAPAKDHPLYDLISCKPNFYQTSFEFRENLIWQVALCGQFFAFKNSVFGKLRELLPFQPGQVVPMRQDDGTISYKVTSQKGETKEFPAEVIWHVRGPSLNSWTGLDGIAQAREAIGLAIATEEQHSRMHKNGLRSSGVYSVEGTLKEDQYEQLKKWIDKEMAGLDNTGKPMVMDRAAKWLPFSVNGVDAQHLETRRFQIEEICRFFRVMPIMVGYSDKAATYASAEQMFLAHVVHTLAPWYQRLEQSMDMNLLTAKERQQGYYTQFVEEGLLRGSLKDTKDFLLGLVNGGLMTPNEGRAKLDLNPDSDPESDQLRIPANIVGEVPNQDEPISTDPKTEPIGNEA